MTYRYLWTPWRMTYISGAGDSPENKKKATEQPPAQRSEEPMHEGERPRHEQEEGESSRNCVFCDRLAMSPDHDRENLVLLRGENNFVIMNLYPYNSAHLMVVPNLHTADFPLLEPGTVGEMMALVQRMLRVISAEYKPEGANIGMNLGRAAGAGVADHVHMHVVPRWAGDTNFMPLVGSTKVMPELLETTYDRLKARLEQGEQ